MAETTSNCEGLAAIGPDRPRPLGKLRTGADPIMPEPGRVAPSRPESRREIRVFVSSTFRDMQAEREEFVKRRLSATQKSLRVEGGHLGRGGSPMGVTDEQKSEGLVLPICLAEIRRCRPYFLGLLGERYGWVPDSLPPDIVTSEPWVAERPGRSVTELEILHGVLDDPAMAGHAFFYFRDPAYAALQPDALQTPFYWDATGEWRRTYMQLPSEQVTK